MTLATAIRVISDGSGQTTKHATTISSVMTPTTFCLLSSTSRAEREGSARYRPSAASSANSAGKLRTTADAIAAWWAGCSRTREPSAASMDSRAAASGSLEQATSTVPSASRLSGSQPSRA